MLISESPDYWQRRVPSRARALEARLTEREDGTFHESCATGGRAEYRWADVWFALFRKACFFLRSPLPS